MLKYLCSKPEKDQFLESLLSTRLEAEIGSRSEHAASERIQRSLTERHKAQLVIATLLVILNALFCVSYAKWYDVRCHRMCAAQETPAWDVLEFERKQFDTREVYFKNDTLNKEKPPFNGPPTPELAAEWRKLVQNQNIRVQKHQLGSFANDGNTQSLVSLSDGSGYLTTLAVYHGLHCLKRFHHYIYRDHYYANISDADDKTLLYHTEHCLDWLRQYVQCNADTTLVPFYWGTKSVSPKTLESASLMVSNSQKSPLYYDVGKHQCVKWAPLDQWMETHSFDAFKPGLLIHPVYGDPYGPNFQDKIGISVEEHILHTE